MPLPESRQLIGQASALTHPSLALTKYWGKLDTHHNIPATPSLAAGLAELTCKTRVEIFTLDKSPHAPCPYQLTINGVPQDSESFRDFFGALRDIALSEGQHVPFTINAHSEINFPLAAGIASSSAGFAALALACVHALSLNTNIEQISSLARVGSVSAARAVYGGFTFLADGDEHATQVFDSAFWPSLRIIVVETEHGPKKISSRVAMEQCRLTSPFYTAWVDDARITTAEALDALRTRNLEHLGPLIHRSYMRMFATMFAAQPPIRYWSSKTLQVLDILAVLRQDGYQFWETMDAGPHVKVFCEEDDAELFIRHLGESVPEIKARICTVASAPLVQEL